MHQKSVTSLTESTAMMYVHVKRLLATALSSLLSMMAASGQPSVCPPNIDFEKGDLANWQCLTGKVESIAGINTVTWTGFSQRPDNHQVYSNTSPDRDIFGGFPVSCPNGSGHSLKLGNNFLTNISAEGVQYTFTIPDTATFFSMLYYYAVVFQDPQHNPDEQPRFRARVYNVTDNEVIGCSDFDFTASASLPGFRVSTVDTTVIYKEWTPVTLNLSGYAGKTLRLEFITSDCIFTGHFGYAYVDIASSCSSAVTGTTICPGANELSVTAPHGFQTYTWYADASYSTILSTSQTMVLSPAPAAGTVFPVVVGPYPGFGCPDTIMAVLRSASLPVANAGPDAEFCAGTAAVLGDAPLAGNQYSWAPDTLVINPGSAITQTIAGLSIPSTFYLTVTDNSTGCMNYDTVHVSPLIVDTTLEVTGDSVFCRSATVNTVLRARAASGSIQWYENDVAVAGANANVFVPQPAVEENRYFAIITRGQCSDRTRTAGIRLLPAPEAGFSIDPPEQCVNGPVKVINKTTMPGNPALNYSWKLSDGREFSSRDMTVLFATPGNYDITLKAVADGGCSDSTGGKVKVIENCSIYVPSAFSPDGDGKNDIFRPVMFGQVKIRRFSIYERNGILLYSTRTTGAGWDGSYRGKKIPASVLVWLLEYETTEGKPVLLKGTVTLIR